jgi:Vitamin K-dependent gamma-carboxylase
MGMVIDKIKSYLNQPVSIYPLAGFRILYGCLLLMSTCRFMFNGWVKQMYITPQLHFTYWGFDWIKPLPSLYMYIPFVVMCFCAFGILIGRVYKMSCCLFFVLFTYIELIDSTNYLNHYYFISLITLILALLPANAAVVYGKKDVATTIPNYYPLLIKIQIAVVYVFAGFAKIEYEWLMEAQPLTIWLRAHVHLPIIGPFLGLTITAYIFSWFGCIYDLFISFFLFHKKSASYAFLAVIIFHLLTSLLFPIGIFPYVMIASAAIFLPESWYSKWFQGRTIRENSIYNDHKPHPYHRAFFIAFFIIQLLLPLRYLCYPGDHLWTEQGYRFSWRVMLVEKAGTAIFYAKNEEGKTMYFDNTQFLTPMQEKQMSFQADQMICYAQYLKDFAMRNGVHNPSIHVQSYVSMNGSPSQLFIDESIDLSKQTNSIFQHKFFILPRE